MRKEVYRFLEYGLYAVLILLVTWTYQGPVREVLYGVEISAFFYVVFLLIRIYRENKRRNYIREICDSRDESVIEQMPKPDSALEREYQRELGCLRQQRENAVQERRQREQETNEYYSMWIHQIKTPIAALRLLIQSQAYGEKRTSMEQELFEIEQYAQMALHYLHLQEENSDLVLKEYELAEIVKSAVRKYSVSFIEKKLSMEFEDFSLRIVTDQKWLEILLQQIISNSVKYTTQGGVHIYLEQQELVIADTGIGIRKEDLPRIFEKGFTGFNGRLEQRSTGIGLYLCRQIAEKLGIMLKVTSEVGMGTQFRLLFATDSREEPTLQK
jgi:signal transduction histidine kinase